MYHLCMSGRISVGSYRQRFTGTVHLSLTEQSTLTEVTKSLVVLLDLNCISIVSFSSVSIHIRATVVHGSPLLFGIN